MILFFSGENDSRNFSMMLLPEQRCAMNCCQKTKNRDILLQDSIFGCALVARRHARAFCQYTKRARSLRFSSEWGERACNLVSDIFKRGGMEEGNVKERERE